jgi:hypothetical protein
MTPISPRSQHLLDQYMALTLDVQARLARHKASLIEAGWHDSEAWALCQDVEERILGPAMDLTTTGLQVEDLLQEMVDRLVAEHRERQAGEG